jgi:assimilatory nitrate reductase catalytic subunit
MNALSPRPAVRTTCPYCGVGCGVLARPDRRGGATIISGDPDHPANFGRLCSKGFALGETLGLEGRLLHPMLRQSDRSLVAVDWDQALDRVANGLQWVIERHGPDAVAFYLSGQLLTEDYYVANKLMKGFIGSANVDTNSRLCMASTVAAHTRAFGGDVVPGTYEDLDQADLIVLTGSNAAWCHPVLYQRMIRNRHDRGAKIVVIDPRRTVTGAEADLFLPIAPGMDAALFCGLLVTLADAGAIDRDYVARHTTGFDAALARAREIAPDRAQTAATTSLGERELELFFDLFAATPKVVTCFSQGVNQSAQGTDKANAIINCHLATGRIGKPGMGPFSLTGQPNAMGGREVGGLANQLAGHMSFTPADIDRVRRFWSAPRMARREGLKAVQMFDAIARRQVKALWVMGTNPAASLPRAGAVRQALNALELFVVSDNVLSNDTITAGAQVLLPAAAWGEKDGTVTNSERCISRQRAFLPLPGEARPDWWIVAEVARRLGFADAFAYRSAADVFREHAALSCFENDGMRAFDLGALASVADGCYGALEPAQWPLRPGAAAARRLFATGGFYS